MMGHEKRQLGFTNIQSLQGWLKGDLVPRNSIYYALSQADDVFRDDLFAESYSPVGRPSTPPSLLVKALLLQSLENVSDREAENRARYDLRWKVALGTNLDEAGFDYCTLSFFRTRLLLKGSFQSAFYAVLNAAAERGLIPKGKIQLIIDSTHVLGAGAVQDTYTLIRLSIRGLIRLLERRPKDKRIDLASILPRPFSLDYMTRNKPSINWDSPDERNRLLNQLTSDAHMLLEALEKVPLSKEEKELWDTLATVTAQDTEQDASGRIVLRRGVTKDRIISTSDPEMRHGHKSETRRFNGYRAHTTIENTSLFITNVGVMPGNVNDCEAVTELLDKQPLPIGSLVGDAAYGSGEVREELEKRHIQAIAPVPTGQYLDFLPKAEFTIDLEQLTCRCPMGNWAPNKIYSRSKQLKGFAFSKEQCSQCPLRRQCFENKRGCRVIGLHPKEHQLQRGRAFMKTDTYVEEYANRYKIEQKQAEMVRCGLRKARYRGKNKVLLQAFLIATAVNFKRYIKLLNLPAQVAVAPVPVTS